ncbi:hypothetical protein HBH56_027470 [Parastagonospora nodorum]|uniref:RING-type domain-containing protein n=1 Tax=Phaeosphaeria nodorum (strain SN15 / ATCC MYA-4574 / FGSC 10173) TaxID=321614 RepID=A0A7U2F9R8_PHANO|nr:hypothetical protein HBH56_027470 [Parastagonospora nodorum]QRC99034.1 hypothetical protein JI435_063820 [Parastagonospora nodorum SN15]KAH3934369.1 hypothetical protein HBH54_054570 [Parastagonospora nodorum]KAH3975999.1 hypothetical protein HBH51_083100 [Parastagonospora nodorum]KAH4039106.1 hypothetical protein HBI09_043970 [Parastagonospora nodorum]
MSRLQQDQFVDDEEEECCPLCVEEFDLSDRNFRPCPCGYQICQFCYNNIKTTMNGLCPACRRPYDDSTIEWKTISPEEMARHKQQIAQKAKKNAQIRQKEAQKAEADSLSRKHLAGLRVVQKNLVYVTGLTPTIREDRLLDTLRGPEYFGQYGKIIKIVVSKARENAQHQQSVGVYVTFARKEDAEQCIKAVDGSSNGDRQLRAQYGTTKYCSAYLRGEQCNNRNCMFLHEPGEDNDSFTRQDLSMMNSIQTQQPSQSNTSRAAPPAHPGPPVAAAAAPMSRQPSNDTSSSSHDAPGLPATASWGNKAVLERRASRSTIASNPSPLVTNAIPAQVAKAAKAEETPKKKGKEKEKKEEREKEKEKSAPTSKSASPQRSPAPAPTLRGVAGSDNVLGSLLKTICSPDFKFVFNSAAFTEEELKAITEFPSLLDPHGGARRRAMREKENELALHGEAETEVKVPSQSALAPEREDNEATAGGSLQLGGEPEDGIDNSAGHLNHHAIAPPGQQGFAGSLFGQTNALTEDFSSLGLSNRGLTTQQQQQLLLSNFKSNQQPTGPLAASQSLQNQQHGLTTNAPGHTRQTSRFSFANDSASASANVQPVANQKLMSQQNSMMPKNANHFGQIPQHQALGGQFFANVQGPPPGLKPTGTPPVGGTSMFGQGHGFATGGLGYGANAAGRNNGDTMYQDLLRSRNMDGASRVADGKHDATFSAEEQASFNVDALVNDTEPELEPPRSIPSTPMSSHFFTQSRRATPTIPPGFSATAIPRAIVEESKSRPSSRPMSRTTSSTITPAVPVVPVTPAKNKKTKQPVEAPPAITTQVKATPETPTKVTGKASTVKTPTVGVPTPKAVEVTPIQKKQQPKAEEKKPTPETPGKESVKGKAPKKNASSQDTSPQKKTAKASAVESKEPTTAPFATPVASTKRQPPGKLDITAASQSPAGEQSPATSSQKADAQVKSTRATPVTSTTSVPASPAAAATGSPIKRTVAPRTLRVVPTPKTENPPPLSAASAPPLPQISTVDKLRSRQASIASMNLPGTPISEMMSDTASVTSTSFSRANSPPPIGGKVGTAPVRKKTKSQAKKDRQERKKQIEEEMAIEENKSDVEVIQAPIIGRKKKTKKPTTIPKSLTKSQPASPKPAMVEEVYSDAPAPVVAARPAPSPKTSATATPDPEHFPDSKERRECTAQSIMVDLQKTGELLASTLEFFKPLSSSLTHASRTTPASSVSGPPDLKIHFSEADLEALAKKKPVRLNGHDDRSDSRTLITPNGKFFWGLSEELEEKALQLERQIEELRGHARFHPRKHPSYPHSHNAATSQNKDVLPAIATALKEAGKKLGNNNTQQMPRLDAQSILNEAAREAARQAERLPLPPVQQQQESQQPPPPPQPQTPADAGSYLNHFVLPKTDNPPPNQPRPEMAAVGGPPGAGTANISVNVGKFAKAAKAVVEGGAVGSTEIDGMGMMAADLLGGVFVQGLEALVGAGLGFESSQEFGLDSNGNITIGRGGAVGGGLNMEGLMSAIEGFDGSRYGRGSVMSMEEAERAMHAAKREHEVLEKKLAALMKKNKKLFGGVGR